MPAQSSYPNASSSADSRGVPQTRQRTAEQSPQTSGSATGRAQVGHQRVTAADVGSGAPGGNEGEISVIQIERSMRRRYKVLIGSLWRIGESFCARADFLKMRAGAVQHCAVFSSRKAA